MNTFIAQAPYYEKYNNHPFTCYLHLMSVILITFGLMIFLGFFQLSVPRFFSTTLAEITTVLLLLFYIRLNWKLGFIAAPFLIFLLWLSHLISFAGPTHFALWFFIIVFVLGFGLQIIGYFMEGKPAKATYAPKRTILAPLFLTAQICFNTGFMLPLKEQLYGKKDDLTKD